MIKIPESELTGSPPKVMLVEGSWVAGGAIRQWYDVTDASLDVDMFFRDERAQEVFKTANGIVESNCTDQSPTAMTYDKEGMKVQCIKMYCASLKETIGRFDYRMCQFGWDGESVWACVNARRDVKKRELNLLTPIKGYEVDAIRRAFKYTKRGYYPSNACLGRMIELMKETDSKAICEQLKEVSTFSG